MKLILLLVNVVVLLSSGYSAEVQFENVPPNIYENIFVYLIQGPEASNYIRIPLKDGLSLGNYTFFNASRETIFYFHGWGESATVQSAATITNAFLKRNTSNIVVFDYSTLVVHDFLSYPSESYINVPNIGTAIGQYLQQYVNTTQEVKFLHLISHSLGSQIMSHVARTYGRGLLPWLTGLDPAGPLFQVPFFVNHLDASDAVFVDVIHTDGGFFGDGAHGSVGTINFFPNRGTRVQPFCENNITDTGLMGIIERDDEKFLNYFLNFCSHHMSWVYYAESILRPLDFPAKKCWRYFCDFNLDFLCICTSETTYMGYNVNKNMTGNFYLTTNSHPPFGQGQSGLDFGDDDLE